MPATPNQTFYRGPSEIKGFGCIFIIPVRCLGAELEPGRVTSQILLGKKYLWLGNTHIDANPTTEPTKLEKIVFNCVSYQSVVTDQDSAQNLRHPNGSSTVAGPDFERMLGGVGWGFTTRRS